MKILFYNLAPINEVSKLPASSVSDYQLDMLLHGLYSLGETVYEEPYHWWMRRSELREESKQIWGKGFTIYHTLDNPYLSHDKADSYDLTIIGLHHTMTRRDSYLESCVNIALSSPEIYGKVIVIDGWDRDYICRPVAEKVKYFKRELTEEYLDIATPIPFAIPEEKIISDEELNKIKNYEWVTAPLIPVNQSICSDYMKTYIYDTEEEYYSMYKSSMFSFTSAKGGFETGRHREIVANGSIPLFIGINNTNVINNIPSHLCIEALTMRGLHFPLKDGITQEDVIRNWTNCSFVDMSKQGYITEEFDWDQYYNLRSRWMKWLREKGTTKKLAEYVLKESFNGNNN
jgi:hypothetical protein